LMLGRIRAEQSDPAGAAEALQRALEPVGCVAWRGRSRPSSQAIGSLVAPDRATNQARDELRKITKTADDPEDLLASEPFAIFKRRATEASAMALAARIAILIPWNPSRRLSSAKRGAHSAHGIFSRPSITAGTHAPSFASSSSHVFRSETISRRSRQTLRSRTPLASGDATSKCARKSMTRSTRPSSTTPSGSGDRGLN